MLPPWMMYTPKMQPSATTQPMMTNMMRRSQWVRRPARMPGRAWPGLSAAPLDLRRLRRRLPAADAVHPHRPAAPAAQRASGATPGHREFQAHQPAAGRQLGAAPWPSARHALRALEQVDQVVAGPAARPTCRRARTRAQRQRRRAAQASGRLHSTPCDAAAARPRAARCRPWPRPQPASSTRGLRAAARRGQPLQRRGGVGKNGASRQARSGYTSHSSGSGSSQAQAGTAACRWPGPTPGSRRPWYIYIYIYMIARRRVVARRLRPSPVPVPSNSASPCGAPKLAHIRNAPQAIAQDTIAGSGQGKPRRRTAVQRQDGSSLSD